MKLLRRIGLSARIPGTKVGRPWRQRLEDLTACGIDYAGKIVLDAGCNVGILAYEISKQGPASLHLLDASREMLHAAELIFRSVETPHRLDLVDLTDERRLQAVLDPGYDIVQLLAVYQHLVAGRGEHAAERALKMLAAHCKETFLFASRPSYLPVVIDTLGGSGFRLEREYRSPARAVTHLVFRRERQKP